MRVLALLLLAFASPVQADEGFLGIIMKQQPSAILVDGTASGASAQKAGVKAGDVIATFNGKPYKFARDLVAAVKAVAPGSTARLEVLRQGRTLGFDIVIVSRSEFLGAGIEALVGKPLPELKGVDVFSGKHRSVSAKMGKPVVVELWATWCPACKASLPIVEQIAKRRKGQVTIIAAAFEPRELVKNMFRTHRPAYEVVVFDESDSSLKYLSNATIPKFIVADAQGKVVLTTNSPRAVDEALTKLEQIAGPSRTKAD